MATAAANMRELGQLRVDALRDACQQRGLPATGRKDQLMARLIEADKARPQPSCAQKRKGLSPFCSSPAPSRPQPSEADKAQKAKAATGAASAFSKGLSLLKSAASAFSDKSRKDQASARSIETDKVEPDARCPAGHPLVPFTTPVSACGCDKCSKVFPRGTQLHSCRKCNYDECGECLSKAQSNKKMHAQGVGKKAMDGKSADGGIRAAAPRSPKNAGTSSSSKMGLACTDDWMRSPVGKGGFDSPRCDQQSQSFPQSPGGMVRRRIREKSPDPHRHVADWRDELGFMGSPACRQTALSPGPLGPRRRIREKSPDPHRYVADWRQELNFCGSPAALHIGAERGKRRQGTSPNPHESALTPGRRLRAKTPEWQIVLHGDACASRRQDNLPHATAAACSKTPVDPVQALLLLSRRELLEMCVEWGVSTSGAKSVLIDRLVEAHHKGPAASPEPEVHLTISDWPVTEGPEAVSNCAAPPSSWIAPRRSIVPPPPSSWTAPPLPLSWTSTQASELSVESELSPPTNAAESVVFRAPAQVSQPEGMPELSLSTKVAEPVGMSTALDSTKVAETAEISSSPTPSRLRSCMSPPVELVAEMAGVDATTEVVLNPQGRSSGTEMPAVDASSESVETSKASLVEASKTGAGSSNDWWRNVASRWPSIVANLKAGAGGQKDAAPSSPQGSPKKRSIGSPSILEGFQSPKRHCSTSSVGSPAASKPPPL